MLGVLYIGAGNEGSRVLDNYNLLFAILMHSSMATMMLTVLTCKFFFHAFRRCANAITNCNSIQNHFSDLQYSSNGNGHSAERAFQPMVLTQGVLYVSHLTRSANNGKYSANSNQLRAKIR